MNFSTLLLDLDNTLVQYKIDSDDFAETTSDLFFEHLSQWVPIEKSIPAFQRAFEKMDSNQGSNLTNEEILNNEVCPSFGCSPQQLTTWIKSYHSSVGSEFQECYQPMPGGRNLVEWGFTNKKDVAIVTGFHAYQWEHEIRLEWADVPATEFNYSLITSMSNMHASKPHESYYHEVLGYLDKDPSECLMVGDGWEADIIPATSIGIRSFWVNEFEAEPPNRLELLIGHGHLSDLLVLLKESR
jgi:FMN phosphatase YigB (HAD superfamily)